MAGDVTTGRYMAIILVASVVGIGGVELASGATAGADSTQHPSLELVDPTMDIWNHNDSAQVESAYVQEVPEEGDEYFEAVAADGSWISYQNPRDEYRSPYIGDGSGKICVTLLNERGEVIVGETAPNTTVTVPTGESLEWHSSADPMEVEFPLTEHYDRPLDADQFGTHPELPQGDGYLDSHCIEWHGLSSNATVEYGEASVSGEHADRITVLGYIEQPHEAWDSDVDPIEDAVPYEETGGGWTYYTPASHGQVVVVLQLEAADTDEANDDDGAADDQPVGTDDTGVDDTDRGDDSDRQSDDSADDDHTGESGVALPMSTSTESILGLGIVAILALIVGLLAARGSR